MDQFWIGSVKSNGVAGTVGIGLTCTIGGNSNSKQNTGNGTINGDYGQMPAWFTLVDDPDLYDAPMVTFVDRHSND